MQLLYINSDFDEICLETKVYDSIESFVQGRIGITYSLLEDADMMIHTSSSMYGGKEHEQHSYVTFSRKKIHKMMRNRYAGFLTETEIENVLNGQDYYFDSEEIGERLESYTEFQQKKFEDELEAFQKEQEDGLTKKPKKKILPS